MAHNDSVVSVNSSEENVMQSGSVVEQLAQAQKEINELKMQLMWMERNYE